MEFEFEKTTVPHDFSILTDIEFNNFREEYMYYKNVIVNILEESVSTKLSYENRDFIARIKEVDFRGLKFKLLPEHAYIEALVELELSNEYVEKLEQELNRKIGWHDFFGSMMGTMYRTKALSKKKKSGILLTSCKMLA